jgi:predicted Zn-dependent protease
MVRYEKTLRDYFFLNRFGDGVVEHLSYRSGDFELRDASKDWRKFFGFGLAVPEEETPQASVVAPDDSAPAPPTPTEPIAPPISDQPPQDSAPPAGPIALPPAQIAPTTPVPSGPSVRDILAAFDELGKLHAPDWRRTLDEWEHMLAPFIDEVLTQLFSEMKQVAEKDQSRVSLLLFLGNLQQRMGFHEEAAQQFKELSDNSPDNHDKKSRYGCALLLWGTQLKAQGKAQHDNSLISKGKDTLEQAKATLEASLFKAPATRSDIWHNVRALSMLVDACCRRGEFETAADYCDKGLKLEPNNQRLQSQRLFIHETLKR